jgi:tetratricopeptide (TPR) repeat protein
MPIALLLILPTAMNFLIASEIDARISALQKSNPDAQQFRDSLSKVVADGKESADMRRAALRQFSRSINERHLWSSQASEYERFLQLADFPVEIRPECAAAFSRCIYASTTGLRSAAGELRTRIEKFPQETRALFDPYLAALERDYAPAMRPSTYAVPASCLDVKSPKIDVSVQLDKLFNESIVDEVRAFEKVKNWEGARARNLELLRAFPDKSAVVLDALLKSYIAEAGETKLNESAAAGFIAYIGKSASNDPTTVEASLLLVAQTYFQDNSYDRALEAVHSYREKYPNGAKALQADLVEALVYTRTEKNDKALAILDRLTKQKTDSEIAQKAQFLSGWTYLFNQDTAKAKEALEMLVRDYPNGEYAKKAKELLERMPK